MNWEFRESDVAPPRAFGGFPLCVTGLAGCVSEPTWFPPLCAPGTFRLSFSAIGACRLLPSTGPCRLLPSLGLPFDDALTSSTLPSLGLPFDLRVPFALFRQSREALDTADRLASLRRGLDTTDTDSAKHRIADDVSPDFYAWVFPKCDHVAVGTGTVTAAAKPAIRRLQAAARARAIKKIAGIEELGNTRRSVVHNFLYLVALWMHWSCSNSKNSAAAARTAVAVAATAVK